MAATRLLLQLSKKQHGDVSSSSNANVHSNSRTQHNTQGFSSSSSSSVFDLAETAYRRQRADALSMCENSVASLHRTSSALLDRMAHAPNIWSVATLVLQNDALASSAAAAIVGTEKELKPYFDNEADPAATAAQAISVAEFEIDNVTNAHANSILPSDFCSSVFSWVLPPELPIPLSPPPPPPSLLSTTKLLMEETASKSSEEVSSSTLDLSLASRYATFFVSSVPRALTAGTLLVRGGLLVLCLLFMRPFPPPLLRRTRAFAAFGLVLLCLEWAKWSTEKRKAAREAVRKSKRQQRNKSNSAAKKQKSNGKEPTAAASLPDDDDKHEDENFEGSDEVTTVEATAEEDWEDDNAAWDAAYGTIGPFLYQSILKVYFSPTTFSFANGTNRFPLTSFQRFSFASSIVCV